MCSVDRKSIIGASLSEPHIDKKYMRESYMYVCMYVYMYVYMVHM